MAAVENAHGGPLAAPPAAPAPETPASVSPAGYWISGVVLLLGIGGSLVWFFMTIFNGLDAPNHFTRIDVPGSVTVELDAGEWVLYQESLYGYVSPYDQPIVEVASVDGDELSVYNVSREQTYTTTGGREGVAIGEFVVGRPGSYTIDVLGEPAYDQHIAVGPPYEEVFNVSHLLWSTLLGVVAFTAGLTLLVVTLVRRGRAKRELARVRAATAPPVPGPGWGPPPGAGWGPPPGQGWGPPPGPPAGPGWGAPPGPPAGPGRGAPPPGWGPPSPPPSVVQPPVGEPAPPPDPAPPEGRAGNGERGAEEDPPPPRDPWGAPPS